MLDFTQPTLTPPIVSKGFGLDITNTDNLHNRLNLHRIVFDHLDEMFPAPNGVVNATSGKDKGMNGFVNGAQGGVGEYLVAGLGRGEVMSRWSVVDTWDGWN